MRTSTTGVDSTPYIEGRGATLALSALVRAIGAAVVACLLPVIFLAHVFLSGGDTLPSGEPDNAPFRAAAILLMLSPALLALVTVYFLSVTWVLGRFDAISLRSMLIAASIPSIVHGAVFYRQGLAIGGQSDALQSFFYFALPIFASLSFGSVLWLWWFKRSAA